METALQQPDSESTGGDYEYEPLEQTFVRRREQIESFVRVSAWTFRYMKGLTGLHERLRRPEPEIIEAREIESLALAEVDAGLPLIHGSASILIWGALEASFRDFLVRWLLRHPEARIVSALSSVRVKLVEYEALEGEDRMRYLVNILERDLAASLRPGTGRFDCLLTPFHIHPIVSDTDRRAINELAAVRNVLVHRAGVADDRLVNLCPWLGLSVGSQVAVTTESFRRYIDATGRFAVALVSAARLSTTSGRPKSE